MPTLPRSVRLSAVCLGALLAACADRHGGVDSEEGRCVLTAGLGTCESPLDFGVCTHGSVRASTLGAEHAFAPTSCGAPSSTAPERVFRYVAPDVGRLTVELVPEESQGFDSVLYVRTPECEGGGELVCNDDYDGPLSRVSLDVVGGQELLVIVDGFASSEASDFGLDLRFLADPPPSGPGGDLCTSPTVLQVATRRDRIVARGAGDTTGATDNLRCFTSSGDARRFVAPDHTYVLSAPALAELRVTVETDGFNAGLQLRADCAPTRRAVTCEDADPGGGTETLVYRDLPEGRYYIVVDGFDANESGHYDLYVEGLLAP